MIVSTLFVTPPSSSQWISDPVFDAHVRRGIDHVYNLSFDSARMEFQKVVQLKPDHPAGHFFLAMVEWWQIIIDIDNTEKDENFYSMLEKVIGVCDRRLDRNENDVTALFFEGGSIGFRGRLRAHREEWLRAANDGRLALPMVQQAYSLAPNNDDILLGIGIYNYYAEVIPQEYPFVRPLMVFFPKGDKRKGIEQLQRAAEKAKYAEIEASYFLLQLLYNYEKNYVKALPLAHKLHAKFPNNPLFHRYVGRCYAALGMWSEMKREFDDILHLVQNKQLGYSLALEREAEYYLGLYEMAFNQQDAALSHFLRCDELSRALDRDGPSGFMTMANLKMGMIFDLQAKRAGAQQQYEKVLKMDDYQDSHRIAEQYLSKPYGQN